MSAETKDIRNNNPELTDKQRVDDALEALTVRGRALKLSFLFTGLLVPCLIALTFILGSMNSIMNRHDSQLHTDIKERRAHEAETRVLLCDLAQDDIETLDYANRLTVEELCKGYRTVQEGINTENSRDDQGRLPHDR